MMQEINNGDNIHQKYVSGYRLILGYLGLTVFFVGIFCLIPLFVLISYPNEIEYAKYFIVPGVISIFIGYMLSLLIKNVEVKKLEHHQDAVLVIFVWVTAILICSTPFWMTEKYSFIQGLFEATSGFTTTGLSVVDVAAAPKMFLLFRSLLLFLGGVGLILVFTSVLSDRYGMRLYNAEGHNDRLIPNLVKSARLILLIYSGYILLGTVFYVIFDMPLFDAINHSIASVSTGGFSTQTNSIGEYNSIGIEIVTIILMLLGSTNFFVHLYLIKGKIKNVWNHSESKFLFGAFIVFLPLIFLSIKKIDSLSFFDKIRITVFQFVSAITTTGFQTVPTFVGLPVIFNVFVILLMLIGAGMGSTGGGIKLQRILIALKSFYWNVRNRIQNKRTIHVNTIYKVGTKINIDEREQIDVFSFIFIYLMIFLIGTLVFISYGNSLIDSMFEFASSLGTVGLSVGITGYNAPYGILLMSMIGMFLGRLEIFVVIYALLKFPSSMKKRVKYGEKKL